MTALDVAGPQLRPQKRAGGEHRGSSYDRAARKNWLLSPRSGYGGNGNSVPCVHCGTPVDYTSVEADRIVPGSQGGSYRRDNVQPACRNCNLARSDNQFWTPPKAS